MNVLGFPRQTPGMVLDILRLLWMLPAVMAVEGKPAFPPQIGCERWNRGSGADPEAAPMTENQAASVGSVRGAALDHWSALSWKASPLPLFV